MIPAVAVIIYLTVRNMMMRLQVIWDGKIASVPPAAVQS